MDSQVEYASGGDSSGFDNKKIGGKNQILAVHELISVRHFFPEKVFFFPFYFDVLAQTFTFHNDFNPFAVCLSASTKSY